MVSGSLVDSDGYSTSNNWNATCIPSSNNTVINGGNPGDLCAPGEPAPSVTGPYSLSNPFPGRLPSTIAVAADWIDDEPRREPNHHAALAAYAAHL